MFTRRSTFTGNIGKTVGFHKKSYKSKAWRHV